MSDIKLDLATGDWDLSSGGLSLTSDTRAETTAQRLYLRLTCFLGEWFLNLDYGTPYFESILGARADITVLDGLMRQEILKEPTVGRIVDFGSSIDTSTGTYRVTFKIEDSRKNLIELTV